jgi:FKBP-type peptidyl-prolyl cis-trans isomerase
MNLFRIWPIFLLFIACNESAWQKSADGKFEYKLFQTSDSKKDAPKLEYGDEITLHLSLKKEDGTVLEDSYQKGSPVKIILPTKMHRNLFEEILTYAGPGDSIVATMRYLDAPDALSSYSGQFSGKNEKILLSYRILSVYTMQQKKYEKDRLFALSSGFDSVEEFRKEHSYVISNDSMLRKKTLDAIHLLKNGQLKTENSPEGLKIHFFENGLGDNPVAGNKVYFYHIAALYNESKIFDDVFRLGARMQLEIGNKKDNLPEMFHKAIPNLKMGSKALIFVPAKLAYGSKGSMPVVPPDADIVLYIETVAVK